MIKSIIIIIAITILVPLSASQIEITKSDDFPHNVSKPFNITFKWNPVMTTKYLHLSIRQYQKLIYTTVINYDTKTIDENNYFKNITITTNENTKLKQISIPFKNQAHGKTISFYQTNQKQLIPVFEKRIFRAMIDLLVSPQLMFSAKYLDDDLVKIICTAKEGIPVSKPIISGIDANDKISEKLKMLNDQIYQVKVILKWQKKYTDGKIVCKSNGVFIAIPLANENEKDQLIKKNGLGANNQLDEKALIKKLVNSTKVMNQGLVKYMSKLMVIMQHIFMMMKFKSMGFQKVWKIVDLPGLRKKSMTVSDDYIRLYSDAFFVPSPYGYKMKLLTNVRGKIKENSTKHKYFSLYFQLHKGYFDDELTWPFPYIVKLSLIDQNLGIERFTKELSYKTADKSYKHVFKKPDKTGNYGYGFPSFVPWKDLVEDESLMKDGNVYVKIVVV